MFWICFNIVHAQDYVPPMLKRPDNEDGKQKTIVAEVVAVKRNGNSESNNQDSQKDAKLLDGNNALSFIQNQLGIKDWEMVYQEKKNISLESKNELSYRIKDGLDYIVKPEDVQPPGIFTLDTRVQINEGTNKIDAVKAVAKAKLGEPLVYKGIKLNNDEYIIVLTLKSDGENQSQNKNQNQEENQDQKQEENQQDEQKTEEQQKQSEEKENEDNKKENRQIQLLLESLEEMDQKEQKEMLNERERILLPDKWW